MNITFKTVIYLRSVLLVSISYEDTINCYNGYHNNLRKKEDEMTYYHYFFENGLNSKKDSSIDSLNYVRKFIDDYNENSEEIYKGLEYINLFFENFVRIFIDRSILDKNIDLLLGSMNDTINLKKLERYSKLKMLDVGNDFVEIDDHIISAWNLIGGIIAKYKFTGIYNHKSMEKSLST